MRTLPSAFAALLLTAMLGCRPDLSRETAAVESLLPVIDNVTQRISLMDTVLPLELAERVRFQCGRISGDSLILEEPLAESYSAHCSLADRAGQLLANRRELMAEASRTRAQLHDLHTDLMNRVANKDSTSTFIEVEFLYVEHLGELADELQSQLDDLLLRESSLRPVMDSLMTVTTAMFVE